MKVLSLKQPWAWLIFHGKPIENRKWRTKYRGPLLIHASMIFDAEGDLWLLKNFPKLDIPSLSNLPQGALIGRVEMIDCVSVSSSPWFFGPYGFVFVNPVELKHPIPARGALGLWEWTPPHDLEFK
jgi:hypothetical protein